MKSEGAQLVGCVAFGLAVALVLAAGYVFDASGALNVEVHYGAGFFPEERWGPGKARRWMQQAGPGVAVPAGHGAAAPVAAVPEAQPQVCGARPAPAAAGAGYPRPGRRALTGAARTLSPARPARTRPPP